MARSKSRSESRQRDILNPSLAQLLATPIRPSPLVVPVSITQNYQPTEVLTYGLDRREFLPNRRSVPPTAVRSGASRVVVSKSLSNLRFKEPKLVALCVRRKSRREVIFALRKNFKGAKVRNRRRNFWSSISC